jgi:soluble lytic murein transglycosylase-like protein
MHPRWPVRLTASLLAACAAGTVRADIYSFVDSQGVTHFSNVPTDTRYRLLIAAPREPVAASADPSGGAWLKKSTQYEPMIRRAAQSAAVRPELVRAVIVVESAFNPRAVSKRGAVGLMQLKPATARRYGVADAFDPEQNVMAGARYLRDLLARYGNNLELTLAAYNAGEDAVERYGRSIPPFSETRRYVPAVLHVYHALLARQQRG